MESLVQKLVEEQSQKLIQRREDLLRQVAKGYIIDNYGQQAWPQLLSCIEQHSETAGTHTIYLFKKVVESPNGEIAFEKIPLLRCWTTSSFDLHKMSSNIILTDNHQILV